MRCIHNSNINKMDKPSRAELKQRLRAKLNERKNKEACQAELSALGQNPRYGKNAASVLKQFNSNLSDVRNDGLSTDIQSLFANKQDEVKKLLHLICRKKTKEAQEYLMYMAENDEDKLEELEKIIKLHLADA